MLIEWARTEDQRLWEDQKHRERVLNGGPARRFERIIRHLRSVNSLMELRRQPAFKFEPLKENRSGQFSMRLTKGDRIIFELGDRPDTLRILQVGGRYG